MKNLIYIIIAISLFSSANAQTKLMNHGGVLQFSNKVDSRLNVELNATLSSQTIEFWISTKEVSSGSILKVHGTGSSRVGINIVNGILSYSINDESDINGTNVINDSAWHHISLTINNQMKVNAYVDDNQDLDTSIQSDIFSILQAKLSINSDSNISFSLDELKVWNYEKDIAVISAARNNQLIINEENSPLVYYNFDEKIGTTVYDVGINSYDTNISDTITRLNFLGDNLQFDGIDDYVDLGTSNNDINNSNFSVSLWYFNDYNLSINEATLLSDNNGTGGYSLGFLGSTLIAKVNDDNVSISQSSLNMGWNYISMTYDNGALKLFINSNEKNTTTSSLNKVNSSNLNLFLGAQPEGLVSVPKANSFVKGIISEVSIFNRTLNSSELYYNMHSSLKANVPGLISYWPMQKIKTLELPSNNIENIVNNTLSAIKNDAADINSAPLLYGQTIYSTKSISNYYKIFNDDSATFLIDNNASSYNDVNFNSKSFLYSSNELNESLNISVNTNPEGYNFTINSKNYIHNSSLLPSVNSESIVDSNSSFVSLLWMGSADYGFDIYRNGSLIHHTYTKSFIDNDIPSLGNYTYIITAKNPYGESNSSSLNVQLLNAKTILQTPTEEALLEAINNTISGGIVELNSSVLGTNTIYINSNINISKNIKLIGDGNIILDGNSTSRHFYNEGFEFEIQNLTLQNGYADGDGSSIQSYSNLRLINVNFKNNVSGNRGTIYSYGNLFLSNVNMNNNKSDKGGALYSYGNLDINNSSFTDNNATSNGGAIYNFGNSKIINSTISSNNASTGAGIYIDSGNVDLSFVTISLNNASNKAGGIYNSAFQEQDSPSQSSANGSNLRMKNSILANNQSANSSENDISGSIYLISNNIITNTTNATITGEHNTSLTNISFSLNSLDKTQATYFQSLSNDSIAIGLGTCTDINNLSINKDQLFKLREVDAKCDLGSIESDKIHFNISNYANSNSLKSLYIIDSNGLEQLVSSNINLETSIYKISTQYDKSYKIKAVLENNSVWYYNFEDNKFYSSLGSATNYSKLINDDFNTINFDFKEVLWENIAPSISFVYDKYKNLNFKTFSVEIVLADDNFDTLTLNTSITNAKLANITQSLNNGILSSSRNLDPLLIEVTPLSTVKKGKISINISLSDAISTTSKSFDIVLEDLRYKQKISKVSQSTFDEITALKIDDNMTFYSLRNNIYNNYNANINTVYYDKYTYSNNLFKEKRFIDINSSLKIVESKDKSYVENKNILSIYDNNSSNILEVLKYTQNNESGLTIYKKYLKEILKLNEEIVYKNSKFTSVESLVSSYTYGNNTQGLVRKHTNRAHMLLINSNKQGHLIEVNENGKVITEDAGTWEIKSVNEYAYLDNDFKYLNSNIATKALILNPSSSEYDKNIAFAVSNLKFVSRGEYYNINDIYSYVYLDKNLKKTKYATLSKNPKIQKKLNFGITYVSLASTVLLCNKNLQSSNANLCNQESSLENVFSNSDIKYLTKNNANWSYWDNSNDIKSSYQMDKLSYIDNKEGFIIKTTKENISIMMPYYEENVDYNSFIELYKNDWYLAAVSETKTVNEVKTLVEGQNKSLVYILVFRNDIWKIHSFNDTLTLTDEEKIEELYINESFWILVEDKN